VPIELQLNCRAIRGGVVGSEIKIANFFHSKHAGKSTFLGVVQKRNRIVNFFSFFKKMKSKCGFRETK
jgi:hypothetical protein